MNSSIESSSPVLVAGTGSIGQRHARLLGERRDVELWLCDTSEACLEQARQSAPAATRAFGDYDEALRAAPATVFVCTPHHLHRPMSVAALEAGCHVFCEKPLAENVAAAREISAVSESTQKTLQVGYVMRFHPMLRRVRKMIDEGELGTLVGGRVMVGAYYTLMASRNRFQESQPNSLILDYTHQPDYLSLLFGQATRVSSEAATLGDLPLMQEPNVFTMTIRYASGALVQIYLDYVQYPGRSRLEVFGDRKSVFVEFDTGQLRLCSHGSEVDTVQHIEAQTDDVQRDQHAGFFDSVCNGQPVACSAADGVAVLQIVEAALQSAKELRAVDVDYS